MLNIKKIKIVGSVLVLVVIQFYMTPILAAKEKINPVIVDIYGTNALSTKDIYNKYHFELEQIAAIMQSSSGMYSTSNSQLFVSLVTKMTNEIMSRGPFSYVNISPIMYPGDKLIYITIDVVEKKNQYRLSYFNANPNQIVRDPEHLIKQWIEYEKLGFTIVFTEKKFPSYVSCPAHHCIFGFDHPQLKKYKPIFTSLVEKNKFELVDVLRNDKDETKRAAAAFLLAHIKNANELINLLIPSISDPNKSVRNNVMRVIGYTLFNTSNIKLPIKRVAQALDFPDSTDRNKAMFIILTLVNNSLYSKFILQNSSQELVDELKLQQPNNHYLSYEILKKISGKNYSDRDYQSWEKWVKSR